MKGVSFIGLGLLILVGCKPGSETNAIGVESGPKEVKVDRQDLVGYAFFDGKVLVPPGAIATAYSPYDLPIAEVIATVGKKVGRGETLIKLSMPDVQAALASAKANVQSAQSAYNTAKAQYDGPVREAQRMLAEARSQEKAARLDVQSGGSSDLEAATLVRQDAEESLRLAIAERDSKLLTERDGLNSATEYLKEVQAGAKISQIKAPISGTVISLAAKPGDMAKSRQALATVADLRSLRIQGLLPPEHSDLVKKGSEILIMVERAEGDAIKGTVQQMTVLAPKEGQESAGYVLLIDFPNGDGLVQPETRIKRLGIKTGSANDVLTVPVAAVIKGKDGKPAVKVKRGSEWVETPVQTGISDGALIEIKSGVSEGDTVYVEA